MRLGGVRSSEELAVGVGDEVEGDVEGNVGDCPHEGSDNAGQVRVLIRADDQLKETALSSPDCKP